MHAILIEFFAKHCEDVSQGSICKSKNSFVKFCSYLNDNQIYRMILKKYISFGNTLEIFEYIAVKDAFI